MADGNPGGRTPPRLAAISRSSAARSAPRSSSDCGYRCTAGRSGCCRRRGNPVCTSCPSSLAAVTVRSHRPPPVERGRRRFTGVTNPARWRISPIVEAAGQQVWSLTPGGTTRSLRGPEMREAPAQRNDRREMAASVRMRTMQWSVRMIHKPFRRYRLQLPLAPLRTCPGSAGATAQIRKYSSCRAVFGQHSNALHSRQVSLKGIKALLPSLPRPVDHQLV